MDTGNGLSAEENEFILAYRVAAVWASTGGPDPDRPEPLDEQGFDASDFTAEARDRIRADCVKFIHDNKTWLDVAGGLPTGARSYSDSGHDFWLTRNGHGAGFWDRELGALGGLLTKAAGAFGECIVEADFDNETWIFSEKGRCIVTEAEKERLKLVRESRLSWVSLILSALALFTAITLLVQSVYKAE